MKKSILFLTLFLVFNLKAQEADIQKLANEGNFIALSHLNIEEWENENFSIPLLRAYIYNAMMRCEKSNAEIDLIINDKEVQENPQTMITILRVQADNYVKVSQYKQAADIYKKIIDDYRDLLGEGIGNWQNVYRMYNALSEVKPLQVHIPHETKIQTKFDKKGLPQVQVRTPKDTVSLIFDTGAGFSLVTESVANRLGIKILVDSFIGGGGIANTEYMKIGFVDTLYLGDILYKNIVFLVCEDEKLTFSEYLDFSMNGVLGLPEIKALSSIKIHKNGVLEISKNDDKRKSNMMLSGGQQIIVQTNDSLLFILDTGNVGGTHLSNNYYNKNKENIESIGDTCSQFVGSFGGTKFFPVYELSNFPIKINSNTNILPKIVCHTQPTWIGYEYDGWLGQDIISKYDYMLLDFKNMYFALENYPKEKNK